MIRESQQFSKPKLKRLTKEALLEWFNQSERLWIARTHYHLRGSRFIDFGERIGVDQSSAYELVKLWQYRKRILARCEDEGRYYGWETCLYWYRDHRVACGTIRIGMAGKNMAPHQPSSNGSARAAHSMSVRPKGRLCVPTSS